MEKALRVINALESEGLITRYAIGGAIAAAFYMEPVLTYDLDVFVAFPQSGESLLPLAPIYAYLQKHGYSATHEHVLIEGTPVQFLPAYNALLEEALQNALEMPYGETLTRVFRLEHLVAIMAQTFRPKDRARITQILEQTDFNLDQLLEILTRHGLVERWNDFQRQLNAG